MLRGTFVLSIAAFIAVALAQSEAEFWDELPNLVDICRLMPRNTKVLLPGSCTDWVKCVSAEDGSDYEIGSCLLGLYYNKDSGKCEKEETVTCPYKRAAGNRCQGEEDGAFLPSPENCTAYVYCQQGEELHSNCPGGLVFHPEKSACVYAQDYSCPTQALTAKPHPLCYSVGDDQAFADKGSCNTYHECNNGVLNTHECEAESSFDHLEGSCRPVEDSKCLPGAVLAKPLSTICGTAEDPKVGYLADENSCSGYHICREVAGGVDREPISARCPDGLFFDSEWLSCRDRLSVKCTRDRCEGMGNKYVNIAGDCASYARCENGVAISTGKCPENYFFDEKTQGCTPLKIRYAACSAGEEDFAE